MRIPIVILLSICFTISFGQDKVTLDKWKNAVVNLEVRTLDTNGYNKFELELEKYTDTMYSLQKQGRISLEHLHDSIFNFLEKNPRNRTISFSGTSIFIKKGNKRYLITARHVVHDGSEAGFRVKYKEDSTYDFDRISYDLLIAPNYNYTLKDTFRIRTEEVPRNQKTITFNKDGIRTKKDTSWNEKTTRTVNLFGFTAFGKSEDLKKEYYPYTFSNPDYDLAVLSLDNPNVHFGGPIEYKNLGNYLEAMGYIAIPFSDISDAPSSEGKNIFTVGFPASTSIIKYLNLNKYEFMRSSIIYSLPVFSFGKVAMVSKSLFYFWTDISVYPGNSGGPIIEDGKLVGIVSKQAIVDGVRIPFGRIIKSEYIKELIKIQETKDKYLSK